MENLFDLKKFLAERLLHTVNRDHRHIFKYQGGEVHYFLARKNIKKLGIKEGNWYLQVHPFDSSVGATEYLTPPSTLQETLILFRGIINTKLQAA